MPSVDVVRNSWREKYANCRKGICDFSLNYDFYFKWLLNKVISCFCINDLPDTVNETYTKVHLILDGHICYSDFVEGQYTVMGSWGGYPDAYYIPTTYVVANPVLGSKIVYLSESSDHSRNGVVITNTSIDGVGIGIFSGGLFDLIHQTATLLADNIISINCCQINSRVTAFFTADSRAKAATGEAVLKKMYAGSPYQILEQDLVEKININPISQSTKSQTLTELVELHNYIIANFFQCIGIRANLIMKKERLITDEIDSQNDFVQLSLFEILASWQRGFDKVNELYGTNISVSLNPVLLREIAEEFIPADNQAQAPPEDPPASDPDPAADPDPEQTVEPSEPEAAAGSEPEPEPEPEEPAGAEEYIEDMEETVDDIIDVINDTAEDPEEDPEAEPAEEGGDPDDSDEIEETDDDSD